MPVRAEVVAHTQLVDLTADDLQLLLSGTGTGITIESYRAAAKFNDARGPEVRAADMPDRLAKFKELVGRFSSLCPPPPPNILASLSFCYPRHHRCRRHRRHRRHRRRGHRQERSEEATAPPVAG